MGPYVPLRDFRSVPNIMLITFWLLWNFHRIQGIVRKSDSFLRTRLQVKYLRKGLMSFNSRMQLSQLLAVSNLRGPMTQEVDELIKKLRNS